VTIVVVDHEDSFTWNLVHAFGELGACVPEVVQSRELDVARLARRALDLLVLSPGPGHPARPGDAGRTLALLRALPPEVPCFGVCFGLQLLALEGGATVVPAREPVHGRSVAVRHDGHPLFAGIEPGASMMRYHSLVVDAATLRAPWRAIAWSPAGEVMAIEAAGRPTWAVQFHPESIGSPDGTRLLANVLGLARRSTARAHA
jgi:anthranilate synthase/aminodeoxychorismate synthase-like glutamine amidotransferase